MCLACRQLVIRNKTTSNHPILRNDYQDKNHLGIIISMDEQKKDETQVDLNNENGAGQPI